MKKQKIALVMTAAMAFSSMPAYAENTKHERVYVVMNSEGQVDSLIDNVRLENEDGLDEIEDSSLLTDIENVGGQETFTQDGEKITWQADGSDIIYQGTGDKELPVVPVVRVTADGNEVSTGDMKDLNGRIEIEVSYETSDQTAALAASLIMLPSEGISDVETTNAWLLQENGMQCLAGWGTAGLGESTAEESADTAEDSADTEEASADAEEASADAEEASADKSEGTAEEGLPDSFSASFTADHADLSWMYTVCSSEPAALLKEIADEKLDGDISTEFTEARALLDALASSQPLPETTGRTRDAGEKINEMNQGLTDLDDGAAQVAEGAGSLSEGTASAADGATKLSIGLNNLTANDQDLRDGMSAMLDAVLSTANEQIAASGLADSGITVPELTQENYQEVLEGLAEQLSPEGVQAAVSEEVRTQVEANREQIEAAVDEEVKKQVIEAILGAMNMEMTAEDYLAGVESGTIAPVISEGVDLAVKQQMNSDNVKNKRDQAVEEQIDKLVEEHTREYMESDDGKAKAEAASQGYESLNALYTQLSQVGALKDGIDRYTAGVEEVKMGAASLTKGLRTLKTGAEKLAEGSGDLAEGVSTLHTSLTDAQKQAAETLLSYLDSSTGQAVERAAEALENSDDCGYDLRPDNMKTVTTFIIRTDF